MVPFHAKLSCELDRFPHLHKTIHVGLIFSALLGQLLMPLELRQSEYAHSHKISSFFCLNSAHRLKERAVMGSATLEICG